MMDCLDRFSSLHYRCCWIQARSPIRFVVQANFTRAKVKCWVQPHGASVILRVWRKMERKPRAFFTPRTNLFYLHHLFLLNGSPLFHFTSTETNGNIFGELFWRNWDIFMHSPSSPLQNTYAQEKRSSSGQVRSNRLSVKNWWFFITLEIAFLPGVFA